MTAADEIRNLMFRYCELIDDGDVEGLADLFADASIVGQDATVLASGSAEVRAMYGGSDRRARTSGGRATKHITTNVLVEVDERAGAATARSYWVLLLSTSPDEPVRPVLAGRYHDRFACVDGVWRFAERAYLVDLTGAESAALLGTR
ncbi:MAG TPA: nuclear transport factor 2 family protein [Acidimicrobiia bacterium]|nr:nuclear transport factor 2 family protein [Acidimicrobiia bacterium]